jgi:hypothetical protein
MGVLQSSRSVIVVSFASSKILEILHPPISETGPSNFAELGPTEQIVALHIGQKPNYPVWQTGTYSFFQKTKFSLIWSKTWCLLRQIIHHSIFIPGNMLHNKIIEESNNFQAFIKIGI